MEFKDYLDLGWMLTPVRPLSKAPFLREWNEPENLITTAEGVDKYTGSNFGVCLGHSGVMSIDVDCVESARQMFEAFGVDLYALLDGAPRVRSREGKDKYFFKAHNSLNSVHKIAWPQKEDPRKTYCVIEFRGGPNAQDVIPPSVHPETKQPYEWVTTPTKNMPELPSQIATILDDWKSFSKQMQAACPWSNKEVVEAPKATSNSGDTIISKFNDAHDVRSILEANGYKKITKNRYLSPNSSSGIPGCNIINDQWVYNNHKSDEWCDKTMDAFALFCEFDCEGDQSLALEKAAEILGVGFQEISDELLEIAENSLKMIASERQKQLASEIAQCAAERQEYDTSKLKRPDNLVPTKGILGKMVKYMLESSNRRQPALAVGAASSFLGAIIGRKYCSETDLRTNIYALGLAPSGGGKEHARKCIDKIAFAAGVDKHIGGENLTSGAAAISALKRMPSQLFKIDEFGLFLQTLNGNRADPHKKDLMTKFMTLYSSAGSVYRGTEYANQEENERTDIQQPNLCIYGTSTLTEFHSSLTTSNASSGSLARFTIFQGETKRPPRSKPLYLDPPKDLIDDMKDLLAAMKDFGGPCDDMHDMAPSPKMVKSTFEVEKMIEELDDYLDEFINASDQAGSIYSRVIENAIKLALIYAVSINPRHPKIDREAFEWGSSISLWSANNIMMQVSNNVAENRIESEVKKILNVIRESGKDGINKSRLTRKTMSIIGHERDRIVNDLVNSGKVKVNGDKLVVSDAY
jgi:hypothetical protein